MRRMLRKTRRPLFAVAIVVLLALSSIAVFIPPGGSERNPGTNSTNPGNTGNKTSQVKIVGKQIPAGYVMGNPVDIELKTGMSVLLIENANQKVSIRFTARFSGEAAMVVVNAMASNGRPQARIGLQEDTAGLPKGEWMSGNGFGTAQIPSRKGFIAVGLQKAVSISKGKVYHIVIEAGETPLNGSIAVLAYMANALVQPLNNEDPDILSPDAAINTLFYSGGAWRQEDEWPIYVVKYSDGKSEGQPYSLAAPWVIHSRTYIGQTVIPASNYKIGKVAFVLSLKGQPKDKLYYEIRDSSNNTLAKGVFAEASQLTTWKTWIEVTLDQPVTFKAGELYRVVLLSPGTDLENAYRVYGHEFSYDPSLGYGGLQHQLVTSHDGGSMWVESEDSDTIFKLTTTV